MLKRLHPGLLDNYAFEADFFTPPGAVATLRFRGNLRNHIERMAYFSGAHEKYMLCFLRDYVQSLARHDHRPLTFADAGANVGNHTLFMSRLVSRVHAFEPFARVRQKLEETLALNRIDNVTVHPFGLSDSEQLLPFYAGPEDNLGTASFWGDFKKENVYLGEMPLKVGDDVARTHNITIDILKADVEGYEKFVLAGLKDTLARDRPLVIVELSAKTRDTLGSAQALQELFPPGYALFYFMRGNYDSGAYKLGAFDYRLTPKIQDVIACPQEKLSHLGKIHQKATK